MNMKVKKTRFLRPSRPDEEPCLKMYAGLREVRPMVINGENGLKMYEKVTDKKDRKHRKGAAEGQLAIV